MHTHVFFLTVWFQREHDEALLSVAIMRRVLRSMVKLEAENDTKAESLRTSNGGLSLCGNEELAWWFVTRRSGIRNWGNNTGEVQSPTLHGKKPRSGLNWLCLTMTLLKALFCERGLSSGRKPKIYDRATMALVHCFLLGGVAFREAGLLVLSWWC
jgi:hypothetical protein